MEKPGVDERQDKALHGGKSKRPADSDLPASSEKVDEVPGTESTPTDEEADTAESQPSE